VADRFVYAKPSGRRGLQVCAYSLRAVERPSVSTPVRWDEVAACREARDPARLRFGPEEVLERVGRDGDLFGPVLALVQELPAQ
jgi:bifunctional non-homologous end joining protein LigD